ncbi:quinon protein alcohol dehydrogenase-like superfamily [Zopfochytrium polystomum]|nr:quinon protein alcohol dehydrogenase-like superfamily [Zopfochytrium polystomum]
MATTASLEPLHSLEGHSNAVSCVAVTGGCIYSGSKDGTIKEWDIESGKCLRTFVGHTRWVRSICVGNGRIFSGSWDDTVREWDLETGSCVRVFDGAHDLGINAVLVDEEANRLYSGADDRSIAVYNLNTGETIDTWHVAGSGSISALAAVGSSLPVSSGGSSELDPPADPSASGFIVSAGSDGTVSLWDAATGECLESSSASPHEVTSLLVLAGGRLFSGGNDRALHEWDMGSWRPGRAFRGHTGYAGLVVAGIGMEPPGGPRVLTGSWDGSVRVWDLITGACVATWKAHAKSVNCIAIADAGRVVTGSGDGTLKVWDLMDLPVEAMGTVGVPLPSPGSGSPSAPGGSTSSSGGVIPGSVTAAGNGDPYGGSYQPYGNSGGGSRRPPSQQGEPQICQFFLRGDCRFGDRCRNLHVYQ